METSTAEKQIWGIHGRRTGEADSLFLHKNFVALGWVEMGDLSRFDPSRDALKGPLAAAYPNN